MKRRHSKTLSCVLAALAMGLMVWAQEAPEEDEDDLRQLKFEDAPLEFILGRYAELKSRTLLWAPKVNRALTITLKSDEQLLTTAEYLEAIEIVLTMNGIALQKKGEKFLRVVPSGEARNTPMELNLENVEELEEREVLISQMITLKHIELGDAQQAIDHLKTTYAKIQTFERMNSILLTDSAANVNKILQLIHYIDQPAETREKLFIMKILYSKPSDIKGKLDEIVKQVQSEEDRKQQATVARPNQAGAPGVTRTPTPRGVIRRPRASTPTAAAAAAAGLGESSADRIIQGEVKIVADDRTGILILVMREENYEFFENIVKTLDVATDPDVVVKVFQLEFADAADVAGMLNDLIGAAKKEEGVAIPVEGEGGAVERPRTTNLREFIRQRDVAAAATKSDGISRIGELSSDNIKILQDKRTNALIIMGPANDIAALELIIQEMDIMLQQVLIEVVILEIVLSEDLQTGFDWLQRALLVVDEDSSGTEVPLLSFAGKFGGGSGGPSDVAGLIDPGALPGGIGGLSYYFTYFGLDSDLLFRATSGDSRARILSSPVIMTTDNEPATIRVDEQIYVRSGTTIDQFGNTTTETELRNVGLLLEVEPSINKNNFVMMKIKQELSNPAKEQIIDGEKFPTIATRSMTAKIAVRDRETIILGGLVRNDVKGSEIGVPILRDLPFIGRLFENRSESENMGEVIVLITPYVSATPQDAERETKRRADALHTDGIFRQGWSASPLAEPSREQLKEMKLEKRRESKRKKKTSAAPEPAATERGAGTRVKSDKEPDEDAAKAELLMTMSELVEQMKAIQERTETASQRAIRAAERIEAAKRTGTDAGGAPETGIPEGAHPPGEQPADAAAGADGGSTQTEPGVPTDEVDELDQLDEDLRRFIEKTNRRTDGLMRKMESRQDRD